MPRKRAQWQGIRRSQELVIIQVCLYGMLVGVLSVGVGVLQECGRDLEAVCDVRIFRSRSSASFNFFSESAKVP